MLQKTKPPAEVPAGTSAGATPRPDRKRTWKRQNVIGLLFVAPAALYVLTFQFVPVAYGLYLSLTKYSPLRRRGPEFIGLDNYAALVSNPDFANALLVTARYVLMVLPVTVAIALVLALLVNRPFRGVGLFRSALYLPHIVSLTAVSLVWLWIYSPNGLVNEVLAVFGLPDQAWLLDSDTALAAASGMRVWKALGSNMVLLLAGLQSIPNALYEAAKVDGAGRWNLFRHVTLPGLRPMLVYVVTMDIIYLAQGFAEIFVLTQGGPLGSTTTVNYLIYTEAALWRSAVTPPTPATGHGSSPSSASRAHRPGPPSRGSSGIRQRSTNRSLTIHRAWQRSIFASADRRPRSRRFISVASVAG